ncbi:MAG: hypothetical protein FJX34_04470 [Alphaproteobacteria bacterium]|nr:hypothetical protein [Alphaproteobacteria bacterium]
MDAKEIGGKEKMMRSFKQTILILIGIGLLWSFHAATVQGLVLDSIAASEELSEEENEKLSDFELAIPTKNTLRFARINHFVITSDSSLWQYFSEVPTSPPDV